MAVVAWWLGPHYATSPKPPIAMRPHTPTHVQGWGFLAVVAVVVAVAAVAAVVAVATAAAAAVAGAAVVAVVAAVDVAVAAVVDAGARPVPLRLLLPNRRRCHHRC